MPDFGIYIRIVNNTGQPLNFMKADAGNCSSPCDAPTTIPSDGKEYTVHFNDPCFAVGTQGTVHYLAKFKGEMRAYVWSGACPMFEKNEAKGPGIVSWKEKGHPTNIMVMLDPDTPGWEPFYEGGVTGKGYQVA
jgi:hypothetical protein